MSRTWLFEALSRFVVASPARVAGVLLGKRSGTGPAAVRGGSRNALCLQGVSAAFRIPLMAGVVWYLLQWAIYLSFVLEGLWDFLKHSPIRLPSADKRIALFHRAEGPEVAGQLRGEEIGIGYSEVTFHAPSGAP